jgi:diguanylate cyclase (GGDEF)-like protein
MDRERMLDMERRLAPVRKAAIGILGLSLIACGPWLGWWTLGPLAVAAIVFRIADTRVAGAPRPEYAMFAAWAASEAIIAVSVAITGGPDVATMSWLAIPIPTLTARFSTRGTTVGVIYVLGLLLAVGFGVDSTAVLADPSRLIAPAALIVSVAMFSITLMKSDLHHRNEAFIDQLTGMLNRKALTRRVAELAQQSDVTGEPVGVIVADLDRFKSVNDNHGHAVGDAVLRDAAYILRKHLRAFDLAYRLGGEEFLVLVPGGELEQSVALAEELREAIGDATLACGVELTMSLGVSASARGSSFDYDEHFAAADAALFEAKRAGRDRVSVAGRSATPELQPA